MREFGGVHQQLGFLSECIICNHNNTDPGNTAPSLDDDGRLEMCILAHKGKP